MKKAYAKPTATKVDFEYEDNVIAQSGEPIGSQARPFHQEHCQYLQGTNCNIIYYLGSGCRTEPDPNSLYL